jgi:hypothetical protein
VDKVTGVEKERCEEVVDKVTGVDGAPCTLDISPLRRLDMK